MPLSAFPPSLSAYLLFLAALLGAVFASFVGCAVARHLCGESVLHGRSRCDSCGATLGLADLIPIFSYIFLRGKCRHCGAKIPPLCPITEALTAAAFALLLWRYGLSLWTVGCMILCLLLLAIALVDLETYLIPDKLLLAGIVCFVLFGLLGGGLSRLWQGLLGGLTASVPLLILVLIMDKVLKKDSMGGGDIKLLFVIGLFLSWAEAIFLLITACIIGILLGLTALKNSKDPENPGAFPFGPAIVLAAVISMLWAQPVTTWYLTLF